MNENENDYVGAVGYYVNTVLAIVRKEWPGRNLSLDGVIIHDPAVPWKCSMAVWNPLTVLLEAAFVSPFRSRFSDCCTRRSRFMTSCHSLSPTMHKYIELVP